MIAFFSFISKFENKKFRICRFRLALEDFDFLTTTQKVAIVKFLSLALNFDPKERAKQGDFAALVAEF